MSCLEVCHLVSKHWDISRYLPVTNLQFNLVMRENELYNSVILTLLDLFLWHRYGPCGKLSILVYLN